MNAEEKGKEAIAEGTQRGSLLRKEPIYRIQKGHRAWKLKVTPKAGIRKGEDRTISSGMSVATFTL